MIGRGRNEVLEISRGPLHVSGWEVISSLLCDILRYCVG